MADQALAPVAAGLIGGAIAESRRQSVVFFQNPNYDALVSCLPSCTDAAHPPKYAPTTSGGHLREKFVATQQAYAD